MIYIENKEKCSGCTSCMSICPHDAITMQQDDCGFKYPKVDIDKCTNCGICERVCAFHDYYDTRNNFSTPIAYAVRHKNYEELKTSRSGAMFIALSDFILSRGGVIYGAGYGEHFQVVHKRVLSKDACKELKGSKYVQSDMSDLFIQVKKDLQSGKLVLFSGTPCQTAGLNSFIGNKNRENLFLCDIVCHGTPSPLVWEDYLCYWENKKKKKIVKVDFRDKEKGWSSHVESLVFQDGEKVFSDIWADLFCKHLLLRPSCGICPYANLRRPSDITIADFWGWQKVDSTFNADNMGCSLVLVNSEKGRNLFDAVCQDIYCKEATIENCMQPNLERPSVLSSDYARFWEDYGVMDFSSVLRKYGNTGIFFQVKRFVKCVIRKVMQR